MSVVQPKLNSTCVAETNKKCTKNTEPQKESFIVRAGSTIFNSASGVAKGVGNVVAGVCDVAVGVCDVAASAVGVVGDVFRSDDDGQRKTAKCLDVES